MKNFNKIISQVDTKKLTNNTQRLFFHLLAANGEWVSSKKLNSMMRSVSQRISELRDPNFGGFSVQCKRATEIGLDGDRNTFYYRLVPRSVTVKKAKSLLRIK